MLGSPDTFGAESLQAPNRLSLFGFTPPASVTNDQSPGSDSLVPPANALSKTLSSGLEAAVAAIASQSVYPPALSWLPSPPWKLLPRSGASVGVSVTAEAEPASANSRNAAQVAVI